MHDCGPVLHICIHLISAAMSPPDADCHQASVWRSCFTRNVLGPLSNARVTSRLQIQRHAIPIASVRNELFIDFPEGITWLRPIYRIWSHLPLVYHKADLVFAFVFSTLQCSLYGCSHVDLELRPLLFARNTVPVATYRLILIPYCSFSPLIDFTHNNHESVCRFHHRFPFLSLCFGRSFHMPILRR
jgi:hypothetical protein